MNIKKIILTTAVVLTIGIISTGSAIACGGGKTTPPPDTASVNIESPTR